MFNTFYLLPTRQGGPHGQTESGGRVPSVNAGACAPRGGVTRQDDVLTDLQSLCDLIVNKTSLSLSLGSLILASSFLFEDHLHLSPLPAATKMAQLIFRNQNYVSSAITFILYVYVHYVYHSVCLVSDLEGSDNVDPLKRDLFIVASCKSRSSHGLGDP